MDTESFGYVDLIETDSNKSNKFDVKEFKF